MSSLSEIEAAAALLSSEEKKELLVFLASDEGEKRPSNEEVKAAEARHAAILDWLREARGSVKAVSVDEARMEYYAAKYGLQP